MIKRGIVIGTSEFSADFLKPLLDSMKGQKYRVLVVSNGGYQPKIGLYPYVIDVIINEHNGWELACITRGKENFEEFIFIHDTTLIKDISLFDKLFAIPGNVVLTRGNYHYMGRFVSSELPNLPRVHDKVTAIMLETVWLSDYKEFEPDLPAHSLIWEEVHGQKRMRIENEYIVKWKGTAWISPEQLAELEQQEIDKLNESTSSRQ